LPASGPPAKPNTGNASVKNAIQHLSQSKGQRAVRALAWVLADEFGYFGFTMGYSLPDLALVDVGSDVFSRGVV